MKFLGAPGWLSRLSAQLLVSAQVMISRFMRSSPTSVSTESAWDSLSLSVPPRLVLSHCLSKWIKKLKKKEIKCRTFLVIIAVLKKQSLQWCLGGSVGQAPDSWFQLRSWSHGCEIEPHRGRHAGHGACLKFSLSLSLSLSPSPYAPPLLSLSLSHK